MAIPFCHHGSRLLFTVDDVNKWWYNLFCLKRTLSERQTLIAAGPWPYIVKKVMARAPRFAVELGYRFEAIV